MGILGIIAAIAAVCAAVYLKGRAWHSFVDDVTKKGKDSK